MVKLTLFEARIIGLIWIIMGLWSGYHSWNKFKSSLEKAKSQPLGQIGEWVYDILSDVIIILLHCWVICMGVLYVSGKWRVINLYFFLFFGIGLLVLFIIYTLRLWYRLKEWLLMSRIKNYYSGPQMEDLSDIDKESLREENEKTESDNPESD
ncbi:MAG: hypothetical protein ABEJ24_01635 [Candidatus Magasanikbacteria bacterium]